MATAIPRATIAETAYLALKGQIVRGELQAGQRLLPKTLAAALEISPTPVKDALLRLERDGLVETEARRGVVVRRFRRAEIAHLYEVRELIERHAVAAAFANGAPPASLLAALRRDQRSLLAALDRRSGAGLTKALGHDRALHANLVALTANPLLIAWHAQVMTQTHTVRVYTPATYTPDLLRDEHGAIIAALSANDRAAAETALARHLARSRDDLITRAAATGMLPDDDRPA
jgi:DNA-binding GntR family transcriptional regulator